MIDTRIFYPGKTVRVGGSIMLDRVEKGSYSLFVQIGKTNRVIRLANEGVWDTVNKENGLVRKIEIK